MRNNSINTFDSSIFALIASIDKSSIDYPSGFAIIVCSPCLTLRHDAICGLGTSVADPTR